VVAKLMGETKVRLPLRIPVSLRDKLAELAEREHRSLNKQIEFVLDRYIRNEKEEDGQLQRSKAEQKKQK
jgi:hypothetical protein